MLSAQELTHAENGTTERARRPAFSANGAAPESTRPSRGDTTALVAVQAERGNGVVLSGEFSGISVAYLATERELGVITRSSAARPAPRDVPLQAQH
jgi:hypothetical protein